MSTSAPFIVSPDEGEVYSIGPFRIVSRIQGGRRMAPLSSMS